jgi:hypothetical protein
MYRKTKAPAGWMRLEIFQQRVINFHSEIYNAVKHLLLDWQYRDWVILLQVDDVFLSSQSIGHVLLDS